MNPDLVDGSRNSREPRDVDKCQETTAAQGVNAMPTFMPFRNEIKIDKMQGADNKALEDMIKKYYGNEGGEMDPDLVDGFMNSREPRSSYFSDEASRKQSFLIEYERTYRDVMLDQNGVYLASQISLKEEMFSQMLQKRPKYKTDASYYENWKKIVYQIAENFLVKFTGTRLKEETITEIIEETHLAMFSLYQALENCFDNKNILDQFYSSYHFPKEVLDLFKDRFPFTENLPPYKTEDFEIMTAPVTPNLEDDNFLGSTYGQFFELMDGDKELGRILAMLVMFTPFDVALTNEESLILKEFQSQVSIIMFNHILSKEKETILSASKRFSDLY